MNTTYDIIHGLPLATTGETTGATTETTGATDLIDDAVTIMNRFETRHRPQHVSKHEIPRCARPTHGDWIESPVGPLMFVETMDLVPTPPTKDCAIYSPITFHRPTRTCLFYHGSVKDDGTIQCFRTYLNATFFPLKCTRHCTMHGNATMFGAMQAMQEHQEATCGHVYAVMLPFLMTILVTMLVYIYGRLAKRVWETIQRPTCEIITYDLPVYAAMFVVVPFILFVVCACVVYALC